MSSRTGHRTKPAAPRRALGWLQFRLRTLLLLVTGIAALLGAFCAYIEPFRQQRSSMDLIASLGGSFHTGEATSWQRRLFGDDFQNLTLVNLADCNEVDRYLPAVGRLPCLETLVVGGDAFTDAHLHRLRLPKLAWLVLDSTAVSDEGLANWQRKHSAVSVYRSDRRVIAWLESQREAPDVISVADVAEYQPVLSQLGPDFFREVRAVSVITDDAGLAHVKKLGRALALDIEGSGVSDAGLAQCRRLTNVVRLHVDRSSVSGEGLESVASFTRLRSLSLAGSRVDDAALQHLQGMRQLEVLDLGGTRVTSAGLRHLAGLDRLRVLRLGHTRVSDDGLAHLARLSALSELNLCGTAVAGAGLKHIAFLRGLEILDLGETGTTDDALAWLRGTIRLRVVHLSGTRITDQAMSHALQWPHLDTLWLDETAITDAALAGVSSLPRLKELDLRRTAVSDAGLARLHGTGLARLWLMGSRVTQAGVRSLRDARPNCRIYGP